MLTKAQAARLKRLININTHAVVERALMGCGDPADWPEIEAHAEKTSRALADYIKNLEQK